MNNCKPFLCLETYGIYHGVAACRIEILYDNDNRWSSWDLQHVLATDWYMFNLECLACFGKRVIIKGLDKLQEWRSSFQRDETVNNTT